MEPKKSLVSSWHQISSETELVPVKRNLLEDEARDILVRKLRDKRFCLISNIGGTWYEFFSGPTKDDVAEYLKNHWGSEKEYKIWDRLAECEVQLGETLKLQISLPIESVFKEEILSNPEADVFRLNLSEGSGRVIDYVDVELVKFALNRFKGNKSLAARYLGITVKTLYNKIEKYELKL